MKVVLNQDIKGIGKKLDIVNVSEGYARNYLLPKKLASIADNKSIAESESKKDAIKYQKDKNYEKSLEYKKELESITITFKEKVGEQGKLFGSITEKDISEKIKKDFNIEVDKKKIKLKVAIKNIGTYTAEVKLQENVVSKIKVVVEEI